MNGLLSWHTYTQPGKIEVVMAKGKNGDSVPNKHLYHRVSYLHQAASYLATLPTATAGDVPDHTPQDVVMDTDDLQPGTEVRRHETQIAALSGQNVARRFIKDLRSVSRKVLIRPTPAMKRTMCKMCDTLLVEGQTCSTMVENPSKGGRKPWADVMAMRCTVCGHTKRFPVDHPRQKRRPFRVPTEPGPELSVGPDDSKKTQKG